MLRRASAICVLILALGCNSDPLNSLKSLNLPFAAARCGSGGTTIDFATSSILVVGPTHPYVEVIISQPVTALAGHTWQVGFPAPATAAYATTTAFETASDGFVDIVQVDTNLTVHGKVSLIFPSARFVSTFTAPWIVTSVTC